MDDATKILLVGVGGFLAGAAAGTVGMYMYSKKFFEEKNAQDIQEMALYYNKKYGLEDKEDEGNDKKESNEKEQPVKEEVSGSGEYKGIPEGPKVPPTAYTSYFDSSSNSDNGNKKKGKKNNKKKVDIEEVGENVWDENPGGLETKFLIFYEADSVLVDEETEKRIEDMQYVIDAIPDDIPEDGVVYLQDNIKNVIYHVTIENMSWSEVGLDE